VLSKHHREANKTARAPRLLVCRFALVSGGCTRLSLPAMLLVFGLMSPCCGSRKRRDYSPLHRMMLLITVVLASHCYWCARYRIARRQAWCYFFQRRLAL
jgi:lipopolysaccharide export LptBFGC system permease protein LptF